MLAGVFSGIVAAVLWLPVSGTAAVGLVVLPLLAVEVLAAVWGVAADWGVAAAWLQAANSKLSRTRI